MTPRLTDAHAHLSAEDPQGELAFRADRAIATCFSCGTPVEWERVQVALAQAGRPDLFCASFGIHPWEAGRFDPRDFPDLFRAGDAVGEIGMDSAWCDVPLDRQAAVFEAQLQMAADLGKPIVLHTKGQEEAVLARVRDFPGPVLVHWYSGSVATFERFAEIGCFFTLGPDCSGGSPLNQAMLAILPLDRMLAETDGLDAIAWAVEQTPALASALAPNPAEPFSPIAAALTATTEVLADARNELPDRIADQMRVAMQRFYGR